MAARAGFLEGLTVGLDPQFDHVRLEAQTFGDDVFPDIKAVVLELNDFGAVEADDVVVIGMIGVVGVVVFVIAAQIKLAEQAGFDQDG